MPQYGTIKRTLPRIGVLRGFNPQEPFQLSQAAPVASGVTIKSGQVISLAWNGTLSQYEWVLGVATTGATPYFALNDSTDYDVVEAGKLPGLSSAGKFEIRTPYYKAADASGFVVDAPITFDGVTGNIKLWTLPGTTAAAGAAIIGFVSRNHGVETLSSVGAGSPAIGGNNGVDSSAVSPITTVTFTTNYQVKVGSSQTA